MRQVQVHGGATSKARASHEPFKEATEASAWGKAGVATGAAPGGLPGGVLGKESGVARGRFTCSLSEDLRPAANRGAIASSGPKVAAVGIASRHRGGEGLGLDYEVADAHKCAETGYYHSLVAKARAPMTGKARRVHRCHRRHRKKLIRAPTLSQPPS